MADDADASYRAVHFRLVQTWRRVQAWGRLRDVREREARREEKIAQARQTAQHAREALRCIEAVPPVLRIAEASLWSRRQVDTLVSLGVALLAQEDEDDRCQALCVLHSARIVAQDLLSAADAEEVDRRLVPFLAHMDES